MCRKWTSALISDALVLKPHQLSPSIEQFPKHFSTYKEYHSGPKSKRGFCSTCGSGLLWASEEQSDILILFAGTIDEEYLCGVKVKGSEKKTEYGTEYKWEKAYGGEICKPNIGQQYWAHAIPGLSDHDHGGPRYLQTDQDGKEESST